MDTKNKTKIVFTSCSHIESYPLQLQWKDIQNEDPDYLLLLGDQIYMDFGSWPIPWFKHTSKVIKKYTPEQFGQVMNQKYQTQWSEPNFKQLLDYMNNEKSGVYGTWDDHDFAWNNACGETPEVRKIRDISRDLFHKWMNCSTNRPEVYCFIDNPLARIIFLDVRYYAEPPIIGLIPFWKISRKDRQLLGEQQFEFLEQALKHDKKYTIVCSGLSLTNGDEKIKQFPNDYNRLLGLFKNQDNLIFLAGDIHKNVFNPASKKHPFPEAISSAIAVEKTGFLPASLDDCRNWGVLEIDSGGMDLTFQSIKGRTKAIRLFDD